MLCGLYITTGDSACVFQKHSFQEANLVRGDNVGHEEAASLVSGSSLLPPSGRGSFKVRFSVLCKDYLPLRSKSQKLVSH